MNSGKKRISVFVIPSFVFFYNVVYCKSWIAGGLKKKKEK